MKKLIGTLFFIFFSLATAFFFSPSSVMAADLTNSAVILDITGRLLRGDVTSLEEQLGVAAPNINKPAAAGDTGYIIIGDSRMTALNATCAVNETQDNWFVVACAGVHMDYLTDIAIPACEIIESAYPGITHWKYFVNLGITDLDKPKQFYSCLSELSKKKDLYFVSVNPTTLTTATKTYGMTNKRIASFNSLMAGIPTLKYVDTYTCLLNAGYKNAEDGFHYEAATTEFIYQLIKNAAYNI